MSTAADSSVVPAGWLRLIRAGFGTVAVWSAVRLLAHGWVEELWLTPRYQVPWPISPPVVPPGWLHGLVILTGIAGAAVALSIRPRIAAGVWVLAFGYLELLDATTYLNHYWAMSLLGVLLAVAPTGSSVDRWWLWLFRGQVACIYLGAGLAKLDPDWILRGEPLTMWLANRGHVPLLGPIVTLPWMGKVLSWAGAAFDLTVIGGLAWRRTRIIAYLAVVAFHTITAVLFPRIGVFPWLMIVMATVWFPPGWIERIWQALCHTDKTKNVTPPLGTSARTLPMFVILWLLVQIVLPLRHWGLTGNVRWNEEGGTLAWRVMAEEKVGFAVYHVEFDDGSTEAVAITQFLSPSQAAAATLRPRLLARVAPLAGEYAALQRGEHRSSVVSVTVDSTVAWNGRPGSPLIADDVDLTQPFDVEWLTPAPHHIE